MKNLAILATMIFFLSCVTSSVSLESSPSLGDEKIPWWNHHRHFFPRPHHKPYHIRGRGRALPPAPASDSHHVSFHPPQVVTECLSDCKDVRTCFDDIAKAFFTRKAAIGSDCCDSIKKMNGDCEKTVFGSFHNPFFNSYVKLHCSIKDALAPSPA
ncbi:unnamed protein product [Cochlearia groenlandica]